MRMQGISVQVMSLIYHLLVYDLVFSRRLRVIHVVQITLNDRMTEPDAAAGLGVDRSLYRPLLRSGESDAASGRPQTRLVTIAQNSCRDKISYVIQQHFCDKSFASHLHDKNSCTSLVKLCQRHKIIACQKFTHRVICKFAFTLFCYLSSVSENNK